jgi:hypothetical protein
MCDSSTGLTIESKANRLAMVSLQTTVCYLSFEGLKVDVTRVIANLIRGCECYSEFFALV